MSIVRWNLKEAGGKLLVSRTEVTLGICRLGKVATQTKALNYPEAYGLDVAYRWKSADINSVITDIILWIADILLNVLK